MTRAKRNLTIHYNGNYLQTIKAEGLTRLNDQEEYLPPAQLAMQLTYKDVWLDFFQNRQHLISELKSGDELTVDGDFCLSSNRLPVLRFSKQLKEQIENMKKKNYMSKTAKIRFIVYWRKEESEQEVLIVLPELYFERAESRINSMEGRVLE